MKLPSHTQNWAAKHQFRHPISWLSGNALERGQASSTSKTQLTIVQYHDLWTYLEEDLWPRTYIQATRPWQKGFRREKRRCGTVWMTLEKLRKGCTLTDYAYVAWSLTRDGRIPPAVCGHSFEAQPVGVVGPVTQKWQTIPVQSNHGLNELLHWYIDLLKHICLVVSMHRTNCHETFKKKWC